MNERIEHCLYQSGLTASGCWDELGTYEQEGIKKFAKFIVLKCAEIADTAEPFLASDLIKEHFGIDQ